MTIREKTEILFRFEGTNPVSDARYKGVAVWPLLRLHFLLALSRNKEEPTDKNGKNPKIPDVLQTSASESIRDERKKRQRERHIHDWIAANSQEPGEGGALYFIQSSKMLEDERGCPFHRFFDSLIELTGTRASSRFLYWNDSGAALDPSKLASPAINFNPVMGKLRGLSRDEVRAGGGRGDFEPVRDLCRKWNRENPSVSVDVSSLHEDCETVIGLAAVLVEILKVRPRVVFLTCFYCVPAFALALACRRLQIPCVEMQHGQQGDWHSMYTHWNTAWTGAADGTKHILPSHFWAWSETARKRMAKWWFPAITELIVGGNPWLIYRTRTIHRTKSKPELVADGQSRRICLVSMQYSNLPPFIWETIRQRGDIRWWFRMHPRFRDEKDQFVQQCRERLGDSVAWEVDAPTAGDLYEMLSKADIHLTGWSTTAHEALYFKVPTILTHENGKDAMGSYIEDGVFAYAETSETLSALLDDFPAASKAISELVVGEDTLREKFGSIRH